MIFNPTARGDKARHFRGRLKEIGLESELRATAAPGEASRLTADAIKDGFEMIVAAGGDGTLNEVLCGFVAAGEISERVRLGVLPLGTVNVFARELGIPADIMVAWKILHAGRERVIDLPCAEFTSQGQSRSRPFGQLGGAGLDALAIERVNWEWKKRTGSVAYALAGVKVMFSKRFGTIRVETEAGSASGQFVAIGNGRLYGPGFEFFPGASLCDGLIHAAILPRVGWLSLAWCGLNLLTRRRLPSHSVIHLRGPEIRLSSPARIPFELDGDLVGELPVTFRVSRQKLRVAVP